MMEFLDFITPFLRIGAIVAGVMAAYTFIKNRGGKSL